MFGVWHEAGKEAPQGQGWQDFNSQAMQGAKAAEVIDDLSLDSEIEKTKTEINHRETEIGILKVQIDVLEEKLAGLERERAQRKLAAQAIDTAITH